MDDAKTAAAEAIRNVRRSTDLPRPLSWLTNGTAVWWNVMRRNEESGWNPPA